MKSNPPACITDNTGMTSPLVLLPSLSLSSSYFLSIRSAFVSFFLAVVVCVGAVAARTTPSVSDHLHNCHHRGQTAFVSTPMVPSTRLLLSSGASLLLVLPPLLSI